MLRRLYPHPFLTLLLIVSWMLLVNQAKLGSLLMAVILGTVIPLLTAPYWPNRPALRNMPALAGYLAVVIYDIVKSNFIVARIVLFMPNSQLRPAWVSIPLDLRTPEAITVLAGTITMTPGTVTSDMSEDGRTLLVHCLHAPDPDGVRDEIKTRYEARLKRIFE
ncbi:Na+/H+ antiporter subunit E [Szabonella alba]|uniref:Na+/H+ antiporter subunit E n=1 Tax=Szabonella alba TaxID=2804194 RepID=A0A8K0V5R4_9RHOB|nr:Na+/H+ antiporter subunit E [Szabonella alba]MBL4915671.1 Na+/H+ antiporter subunit E [Szabonella alba]